MAGQFPLRRFLELQAELQNHIRINSGRANLNAIKGDPISVGETIKEDALALEDEIHEALDHVGWKSWAKERGVIDREAYLREMVDALFFWLNLVNIVNASADEICAIYDEKWRRNWARYADGNYSMVEGKCPGCGDDFGDVAARKGIPLGLLTLWQKDGLVYCSERCFLETDRG